MERSDTLLRRSLLVNGVFSISTGLIAFLFADAISEFMSIEALVLRFVGVAVLVFGLAVYWFSRHETIERGFALFTTVADLVWVVGSVVLLVGFPDLVSSGGSVLIAVVALFVLGFAVGQWAGLRR